MRENRSELTFDSTFITCPSRFDSHFDAQFTIIRHTSIDQHLSSLVKIQLCSGTPSHTFLTLELRLRYILPYSVKFSSLPSMENTLATGRDRRWILIIELELEESERVLLGLLV